ncbi:MAG: EF-hand domain-containing protein [Gammaproteobacteria bacterium]
MTSTRFVPALILAVFSCAAFAHDGPHGPAAEFDADEDGKISLSEYTTYLKSIKRDTTAAVEQFATLDRDKSGFLSDAEFITGLNRYRSKPKSE